MSVKPCGKVGCPTPGAHVHTGVIQKDERVVVVPKLMTAPGWAYERQHGRYVGMDGIWAMIALDDGTTKRTMRDNLVRERLFKSDPVGRQIPKPLHQPSPPLGDGWEDVPLFGDAS